MHLRNTCDQKNLEQLIELIKNNVCKMIIHYDGGSFTFSNYLEVDESIIYEEDNEITIEISSGNQIFDIIIKEDVSVVVNDGILLEYMIKLDGQNEVYLSFVN